MEVAMGPSLLAPRTFFHHGLSRLEPLCDSLGLDRVLRERSVDLFRTMTGAWGDMPVGEVPRWPSDITDDHTPYEFSLAIEHGVPELRMLVEAQGSEPTVAAQWEAGRALTDELERRHGARVERLRAVEDLFAIGAPDAKFGIWHAAGVRAGARPGFKVYLNPQARGRERAAAVVQSALERLGFRDGFRALPLGPPSADEIKYFALDLEATDHARVKVYLARRRATCADIESALSVAADYTPGEATAFCRAMAGSAGPYLGLPVQLCFSFTGVDERRPRAATVYFPARGYVESDRQARDRILTYMDTRDRILYERALRAFAARDLRCGTGMHTYVAYREQRGRRRVTIYLSPEAYQVGPRRPLERPVRPSEAPLRPAIRESVAPGQQAQPAP
jgi:DMATS type aromatic prenyltransferase